MVLWVEADCVELELPPRDFRRRDSVLAIKQTQLAWNREPKCGDYKDRTMTYLRPGSRPMVMLSSGQRGYFSEEECQLKC